MKCRLEEQTTRSLEGRFRLRAHTLKVEAAVWQDGASVCVADVLAMKLKMKHMFFLTALMSKFILCTANLT
eukprot:1142322-Pelagomonas_calceolata.AAC.1